ncbi:unnamed protein product [Sphagnum balticum]
MDVLLLSGLSLRLVNIFLSINLEREREKENEVRASWIESCTSKLLSVEIEWRCEEEEQLGCGRCRRTV